MYFVADAIGITFGQLGKDDNSETAGAGTTTILVLLSRISFSAVLQNTERGRMTIAQFVCSLQVNA